MRHIAALALALAVAAPAQADVVYNWVTDTGRYEGKMVFDDSGVESYSAYHYPFCDYGWPEDYYQCTPLIDPDSPLLLFQFGYLNIQPRLGGHYVYNQVNMRISPSEVWMDTSFAHIETVTDDSGLSVMSVTWDGTPTAYFSGRWVREQAAAVPLPGTLALIGLGLLGVRTVRRRGSPNEGGSELTCV